MTMISRKDFTSSDYRLFMLPAFTRAFLFKSSPLGELSYNTKKRRNNPPVIPTLFVSAIKVVLGFLF